MKSIKKCLKFLPLLFIVSACVNQQNQTKIMKESDFEAPPIAATEAKVFENFGIERTDNYFWMFDKENPKVIDYLNAENAYTDMVMASTETLQEKIYDEIIGRIKEDDEAYPTLNNGYHYFTRSEKGKQYRSYIRKKDAEGAEEEIFFDVNEMAEGKPAYMFGGYNVSPDNSKAAYFYNETGSFADYTLRVRDLLTGEDLAFSIKGASSVAWANDNKTLYYGTIDPVTLRSHRIYRQPIEGGKVELIFEEKDERFNVGVSGSKTREWIMISTGSSTTSEEHLLDADDPKAKPMLFAERVQDVDYSVYPHGEFFFIQYKDRDNLNSKVYRVAKESFTDRSEWEEIVPHKEDTRIERLIVQKEFLVIGTRKNGLSELEIRNIKTDRSRFVSFPEPVYTAFASNNPEYEANTIRYSYTSLNRPTTLYEYDCTNGNTTLLKQQEVPSGFKPDDYVVERLWADADGRVRVPMAIVYKRGLKKNGKNPALLYAYGSYGNSTDVFFSTSFYSLIDRGFVFGIAQIRGGSELGEQWYEDGKMLNKKNTFTDFIACSEKLINDKYTSSDLLAAMGGSAGGLLMGAVANMRPELYQTIVAQVPFVDVVTTMLDDTLPLTVGEYEEWGNPNEEEYFKYMLSYSPYDNIKEQNYPNILITGGINDSQVLFHEPTKYAAKLRAMKTDDNITLLKMNMDSGHGGATGRYDGIRETAFELAFILNRVGIEE